MRRPFSLGLFLLVVAIAALDVVGHVVGPVLRYSNPSPLLAYPTPMKVVAFALLVLAFSAAVVTYLHLEPALPGRHGAWRGLRIGLAFVGFWLVGGLEMPLLNGGHFWQEIYTALVDSAALLCVLVTAGATAGARPAERPARVGALPVLLVVLAAGLGRAAANLLDPLPGAEAFPVMDVVATVTWALSAGGVYLAIRPALGKGGPWRRAGLAALVFGGNVFLGFCFIPVFVRIDISLALLRWAVVVAFSAVGFAGAELWGSRAAAGEGGGGACTRGRVSAVARR